ncbi:carbonic anhydrase [Lentithecium fluviatile CBS 122367]|uniref:Carbonic anhydrase n=1 Tax=Lentithecium fluviatile CBS 122367 TaxID=1168545 RepID=A0A6G1IFF0_9PLEO|nr:carbonic anhydrase [Lentithecium fluviatile CBS 122367]
MTMSLKPTQYLRSRVASNLIPSRNLPKAQVLWIGCSDGGFAETKTLDLLPEEIIVHSNPGNVLSNDDLGIASTLEYALNVLQVKHIVVCGHYDCRLVNMSASKSPIRGWLRDVNYLCEDYRYELERIEGLTERNKRLVELHAWSQAQSLLDMASIRKAQREKGLEVHAFVYDSAKGECVELFSNIEP